MSDRETRPILLDMLAAIEGIETHTSGLTLSDFKKSWLIRLAVQRALEIISEASRRILEHLKAEAPEVRWKQIHGIGNILRHEYHRVADELIWNVVTDHIGPLKTAIMLLLSLEPRTEG